MHIFGLTDPSRVAAIKDDKYFTRPDVAQGGRKLITGNCGLIERLVCSKISIHWQQILARRFAFFQAATVAGNVNQDGGVCSTGSVMHIDKRTGQHVTQF